MADTKPGVPQLRFPEFEGEWPERRLGQFLEFKNGVNADKSMYGRGHKFINVMDIVSDQPITSENIIGSVSIPDSEFKKNEVLCGDLLFQRSSETREEVGQSSIYVDAEKSATFGGFVIRGRPISDMEPMHFHWMLKTARVRKDMTSRSGGSTRYNVGQDALAAVVVYPAPTLPEQKKIAAFLGAVEAKLNGLQRKRNLLTGYKRGVMQRLFSGVLRFKRDDGSAFPDWEEMRLGEVLSEHGLKSTGLEPVFSVSVQKGLVDQIEHLGRSFSAKETDHYNRVLPSDIVYTKSPTGEFPLGIVKQSKLSSEVIVSPLYGVFEPETKWLGVMLDAYFASNINTTNYLKPIVQKGAKNTINVTNTGFLSGTLPLPIDHGEQRKIADFLSALDAKIDAVASQITQTEAFKKGLLQQMFV
ncbi:restriction endonuclease subunit S [Methyloligella solikamskensis]|uniref:Restriction endonuclease subunit S n=1 Tax=Methyloligella solikamskensis TaxID=1177756 RepID=A0ABW3J5W1_9HYPH